MSKMVKIESARANQGYTAMADSGDNTVFTVSGVTLFSGRSGYAPTVRPDGIYSGHNILSPHADDDKITYAAFGAQLAGTQYDVPAGTATITRPTGDNARINSFVLEDDGETVSVLAGTEATGTEFSSERGAAGGPPDITAGFIELGQVRVTSSTSAAITEAEIFQTPNQHVDRADFPVVKDVNNIGDGSYAESSAKKTAYVEFTAALQANHAGSATKGVYIDYSSATMMQLQKASDFVPPETTHSQSSEEHYDGVEVSVSSTGNQGSFNLIVENGITDFIITEKNQVLTVDFYPDSTKSPYIRCQGTIGLSRSYPVSGALKAGVTITGNPGVEFTS